MHQNACTYQASRHRWWARQHLHIFLFLLRKWASAWLVLGGRIFLLSRVRPSRFAGVLALVRSRKRSGELYLSVLLVSTLVRRVRTFTFVLLVGVGYPTLFANVP